MATFKIGVKFGNMDKFNSLINVEQNARVKTAIHSNLKTRVDPYTPMKEGPLSQGARVDKDGVHYSQVYAWYQYMGEVWGPNWPIMQNGVIVGWRSPKGKGSKHPTGRHLNYSKEKHALATDHWNQAMYRDHKDEFDQECEDIIRRELYGR